MRKNISIYSESFDCPSDQNNTCFQAQQTLLKNAKIIESIRNIQTLNLPNLNNQKTQSGLNLQGQMMNKALAKHIVTESYRAGRPLENLLPLLKTHCTEEEYKVVLGTHT
jgi:hypothetical protein